MAFNDAGAPDQKLDPSLRKLLRDPGLAETVPVIIQTVDGLKDEDKEVLKTLRGTFKDDLYIIKAFSADIPVNSLETLILSPRVVKVYHDADVKA
ncbi:MAG: hypothetical protein KC910_04060 [Candidatus Eremiobacteraeota bacterium]|nr:hypothetical protein [Candidatus Eremiobacteraeota bacterium]